MYKKWVKSYEKNIIKMQVKALNAIHIRLSQAEEKEEGYYNVATDVVLGLAAEYCRKKQAQNQ